jgi:hypothetical protein
LDRLCAEAIAEGRARPVSSRLGEIADRIARKRSAHDAKAEEWAKRLDAIDKAEPGAFAAGDAAVAEREADMKEFEDTIRQLSNLPLAGSPESG